MKKTVLICLALLCATIFTFGKSYTQQGIAYLYDYKTKTKKPIGNVIITVIGAPPATSRDDGTFTLEFADFEVGKRIVFAQQPISPGLTVLNKKETENWYTFEGRLTLIMCSKKDFDTCKQNYYDVGFKSITQRYDQKIAALKKESADYQQQLLELEEERDRIMDNLRNSADAMARIDQSELDDAMQEVLDLYERGEVEEAMQKLEDMKLEEKLLKTLDKKHESERIVAEATEAIENSLLTLNKLRTYVDVYKNNGNWDKVAETLKLLADKLNTYDDVFAYAKFCHEQNDFKEAEDYYKKAFGILDKRTDKDSNDFLNQRTILLNNLANLYSATQRFTESEKMYKEALEIRRRLEKDNPQAYEPNLALTLHGLAFLYSATQRFTESEAMYKEALKINRRLAKENPKAYEKDVVNTLNGLASLYSAIQRLTESEEMYKEALEISRRLAKDNPKAYEQYVAMTLNGLAIQYSHTQRLTESEEMYKEALEICRRLAKDNPKAYEPDVALTLGNMSFNAIFRQQYAEAEQLAREGLAVDSTQHFIYSNLAASLLLQGKYTEAEPLYRQYKDELKESFLDDFKQFAEAGVIPKEREEDVERIKRMLEE